MTRNEKKRARYANDPEYREKMKVKAKAYVGKHAARIRNKKRERYANDQEFREHTRAGNDKSNAKHRDAINFRWREKYANDPEYRERLLTQARARYAAAVAA